MYEPLQSSFYRYPVELNELFSIDWMFFLHRGAYASRPGGGAAAISTTARGNSSRSSAGGAAAWHQLKLEHDHNYHDLNPIGIHYESVVEVSRRMLASRVRERR